MSGGVAQVLSILDSLPIAALVYDQDLHCIGYNGKAQMLVYLDRPVHHALQSHVPSYDVSTWGRYLRSVFTRSRPLVVQPVVFSAKSINPSFRLTFAPIKDEADGLIRTGLATFENLDFHGGRRVQGLEQVMILQLAHRINSPLDGAIRSLSLALTSQDPTKTIDYIRASHEALLRARMCIREVLEHARYRLARTVSLEGLIQQAIEVVMARCNGGQVEVRTSYADGIPQVRCPGLFQVMCNIITNAFQAMPGGGTLAIHATAGQDGYLKITVKDSGSGIDSQSMHRIFEPFFTTKSDGTGLGLVICKDILERYSGSIEIQNLSEGGAMVTIRLPLTNIT